MKIIAIENRVYEVSEEEEQQLIDTYIYEKPDQKNQRNEFSNTLIEIETKHVPTCRIHTFFKY